MDNLFPRWKLDEKCADWKVKQIKKYGISLIRKWSNKKQMEWYKMEKEQKNIAYHQNIFNETLRELYNTWPRI